MGICRDQATTYLRGLGYNAVRHPDSSLLPLEVIGREGKFCERLGRLDSLVTSTAGAPTIAAPVPAADLAGQTTSSLSIGVGANVLGAFVGAMGGTLGAQTSYTNAKRMTFEFAAVTKVRAEPAAIGSFIQAGELKTENPVLVPWVLGKGRLFVIVEVARAQQFAVRYERAAGQAASVNVDALGDLTGANVEVAADAQRSHVISYEGDEPLTFAFKCFEIGYLDGMLALSTVSPGAVALSDALDSGGSPVLPGEILTAVDEAPLLKFEG
jgi:hypothetical protein